MASHARLPRRGATLLGLLVGGTGLTIVLLAADVIPADPRAFHAPRWVVAAAGLVSGLGGLALRTGYGLAGARGGAGGLRGLIRQARAQRAAREACPR